VFLIYNRLILSWNLASARPLLRAGLNLFLSAGSLNPRNPAKAEGVAGAEINRCAELDRGVFPAVAALYSKVIAAEAFLSVFHGYSRDRMRAACGRCSPRFLIQSLSICSLAKAGSRQAC